MNKLLSQDDLATRWGVTIRTIENWRKEGIITPCKGIPAIRFTEQHILDIEGVKLEKVSPLMYRKLEIDLEKTKQENEKLKGILAKITAEASQIYK
ncbi:MerR family transcriptional regulator [Tissierella creatinophila]|uniref:Uncharacterized protein n=1 Tax=Tissierella creatinophila DSM 6911 TaxID=1123403 RepID=A0A1U7M5A8_TISCR|nr:helix-turn-helix domain-containing protein [Tissierella creatinophila]OLS02440.1 hypothetical protein TICRE_15920 [Tissierella creatinophila DSM 6911]